MINETSLAVPDRTEGYLSAWTASLCDVLEKITGTAFTTVGLSPQEVAQVAGTLRAEGLWLRFTVAPSGDAVPGRSPKDRSAELKTPPKGEQSFGIGKLDALRLAQILMGEPFDPNKEFSSEYRDALDELFRQFAGTAALALKPRLGGEVNLQLAGSDAGNWTPHLQWGVQLKSEGEVNFPLVILLDPDLGQSLDSGTPEKPGRHSDSHVPSLPAKSPEAPKVNRNVDLLLDVELPVALRFGKSEMTLSSILGLSPGAVVELDQRIAEPVELLVGGKVVAQGEVVVMDGHYALRVTDVLNPLERLESLRQ